MTSLTPCPTCNGLAYLRGRPCPLCRGAGMWLEPLPVVDPDPEPLPRIETWMNRVVREAHLEAC